MQTIRQAEVAAPYVMSLDNIAAFIQNEIDRGASQDSIRRFKRVTNSLFEWLPEDKTITKDRLFSWRQHLKAHGYSSATELNYIKGINRYLDFVGCSDIRFNRGRAKDITGKQFGYLTAIEPTGGKNRKDNIWRCQCKCGKEVEYPATRLLTGRTVSCGCLRGEHFKEINKYFDGTSLRQSIVEQVTSTRSMSGYTGVMKKRGKWLAYIKYKGQNISLGCYTKLEDAVKARARGKELVQQDAMNLLGAYEERHKDDPPLPNGEEVRKQHKEQKTEPPSRSTLRAIHSNNSSGHPGVHRKRDKWAAKINYQKVTYCLGVFEKIEDAVAARKAAEQFLIGDPSKFSDWVLQQRIIREVARENPRVLSP